MRIDDGTFGNLNADQTRKIIHDLVKDLGLEEAYSGGGSAVAAAGGDGNG